MLRDATSGETARQLQIRRLNRFQYNNSVKDLFRLKLDVFVLPEKLMTRHQNYLSAATGKMPDRVEVASNSLKPAPGLRGVKSFPKDLRAANGFDNQANQLTLSPLLLDAFLRLSVSIVESPDFNESNVGIWDEFFKQPAAGVDARAQIKPRLASFLYVAFRGPVEAATLERYTAYAAAKMDEGLSFTDSMRKVASAALCSPMFLFRSDSANSSDDQFELASNLSYFLWGSCPDVELLRLAETGELANPDTLDKTIERMFADPRIERFLDTFPGQWLQLENVLAATPDPQKFRLFSLDESNPASLQMLIEPLLLFDAVFIEDRPIVELIAPRFSYQSDFLQRWYASDLQPPRVDAGKILEANRLNDQRRNAQRATIKTTRAELDKLIAPIRARLLEAKKKDAAGEEPVDLKPLAAWEFNGDLKDSINSLDLKPNGKIRFQDGMVHLDRSFLLSGGLPVDLRAKTLEVRFKVHNLKQSGGGLMGIQGRGDFFDTIVLGERKPQHWISGSNGFSRTLDFPDSTPETVRDQLLHLAMVYREDGTTMLYRNGQAYGKPFRKGAATFPKDQSAVIFGLRHLPSGGNKFLTVSLDRARLYNRALSAEEVKAASRGDGLYVSDKELLAALTPEQLDQRKTVVAELRRSENTLKQIPAPQDPAQLQQQASRKFDDEIRSQMKQRAFQRVAVNDPRYGGVITNAAMLSMTSGPKRTHPIARGAWIIEVIFNDPPPPPPNDVPPLSEDESQKDLTIRERFAAHRENPDCASCHARIDPLGFALENFDVVGRWRDKYENGRDVEANGTLMKRFEFDGIVKFKAVIVEQNRRFAKAFTAHLLRYALSRELTPADSLTVDAIVESAAKEDYKLKSLIKEVVRSDSFLPPN
jgi:hypothetical protein